jgi:APA family basic amino acid/polyamine antiporter
MTDLTDQHQSAEVLEQEVADADVFVRRSSGLVRAFSMKDAAIMNFSNINFGLNLALVPILIITLFPDANLPLTVLIGGFVALFQAGTYAYLGATFPRSGGDYVFGGRIVAPAWGFSMNWAISWACVILTGLFSSWFVLYGIAATTGTVGLLTRNSGLESFSSTVQDKGWVFGLSVAAILLMGTIVLLGPRLMSRIYWCMFIPAFIAAPVITIILVTRGHSDFVHAFNHHLGAGAYASTIAAAKHAGINVTQTTLAGTLAGLPLGYYSYAGFSESVYFAGDMKQAAKNQPRVIFGGLAFSVVLQTIMFALITGLVGKQFLASIGGLQGTAHYPLKSAPLISALQSFLVGPSWINWFVGIGITFWVLMLVGVMILISIRNIFAWGMDRLVPAKLTAVTGTGSPIYAGLLVMLLGGIFAYIQVYSSFYTLFANVTVITVIVWLMMGVTAFLFPIMKPDLFARAPAFVQRRIAGVPVIQLFGVGSVLLHGFVLYYAFKYPAFSGPISWRSDLFVAFVFLSAPVIYYAVRAVRLRREGVDLGLAFKAIPPE